MTATTRHDLASALLAKTLRRYRSNQLPLLPWTILRRPMLDPKTHFSLRDHQDLVDIYGLVAREIVVKKAAQRGLSEWLISYALHACDERGMDVIYTMPTDADVSDFSQSRFGPAIEASPYLAGIVVDTSQANENRQSISDAGASAPAAGPQKTAPDSSQKTHSLWISQTQNSEL